MSSASATRIGSRRTRTAQVRDRREWWELVFFCWRWFVVLVPATAQAIEVVIAAIEGRMPSLVVDVLK